MKTLKEMAATLNGREYKQEMTPGEIDAAREAGMVVVYGQSDDTTVFHGAVEGERNTTNGGAIYLTERGFFEECACDCIHCQEARKKAACLNVLWCKGPYVWHYDTTIPHETFEIIDNQPAENLKFCQGIVFYLGALK